MSAISTSMPRALAACSASNATDAASAFWPCAITGTSLRSPQACSCATAAARKVSPAASISVRPSSLKRRASLPMVVVLPTPLTPTVSSTKGLALASITQRLRDRAQHREQVGAQRARAARWRRRTRAPSCACAGLRPAAVVAATPTSAVSSAVSISSSRSSSSFGLRENRPPRLRAKPLPRRRSRQPGLRGRRRRGFGGGAVRRPVRSCGRMARAGVATRRLGRRGLGLAGDASARGGRRPDASARRRRRRRRRRSCVGTSASTDIAACSMSDNAPAW